MKGVVSVNGEIFPAEKAAIPATDRGFLFGDNVFEVTAAFWGQPLDIKDHLARLRYSANLLRMKIPWSDDELEFELRALAEHQNLPKAVLRLVITRGCGMGLGVQSEMRPNKVIYCYSAEPVPEEVYQKGMALQKRTLPYTERQATAKTGNYLRSIVALDQARAEGFDDILWLNQEREVTEASTANIFFMGRIGDKVDIATPPLASGILGGITRQTILRLLKEAGIKAEERFIVGDELARFDEAFLCSSVRGLVPVRQLDSHKLYTTRKEGTFQHVRRLFDAWVQSQVGFAVDWNSGKKA